MPSTNLTIEDRENILKYLHAGKSQNEIARLIKRSKSVISYEIRGRGFTRDTYSPHRAHKQAQEAGQSRKWGKSKITPKLASIITYRIRYCHWSPEQIAGRLKERHPEDKTLHISHESIYQWIYSQELATKELLINALRKRKKKRSSRKKNGQSRGAIQNAVSIHKRLSEHSDRSVIGNWEGDLIIGKDHRTALGTLVDRSSRFVILIPLGSNKTAEKFSERILEVFDALDPEFKKSLTYDRGSEMSCHAEITEKSGVPVYFADPGCPYQRGTNENMNGLLREFFPKGSSLDACTYDDIREVQNALNRRPRKLLGYRTPEEVLGLKNFWAF